MLSKKRCVIITGTSRGLGEKLANAFLKKGHLVVGCARKNNTLKDRSYHHYNVDICNEREVANLFLDLKEKKLIPSILINSAAVSQSSLFISTNSQNACEVLNTNILGLFHVSKFAVRIMQKNNFGRIVNLSSINVPLVSRGSALYNASKAGMDVLGQTLAAECIGYDITINTIGISLVEKTNMFNKLNEKELKIKKSQLLKPTPIKTNEIMAAINFLCSEDAKNITAQTIYFGGVR